MYSELPDLDLHRNFPSTSEIKLWRPVSTGIEIHFVEKCPNWKFFPQKMLITFFGPVYISMLSQKVFAHWVSYLSIKITYIKNESYLTIKKSDFLSTNQTYLWSIKKKKNFIWQIVIKFLYSGVLKVLYKIPEQFMIHL